MSAGAFISASFAEENSSPPVFTLTAADGLKSVSRPAFNHLAWFLASRNPSRWSWLERWKEELFSGLDLLLQLYFLKKYGSTFSEYFYGLSRSFPDKRRHFNLASSILFEVILPYLKAKADSLHEKLSEEVGECPNEASQLLLLAYPYLHFAYETSSILLTLGYALNLIRYHSVATWLPRIKLNFRSHDDDGKDDRSKVTKLILYGLETGAFFLQFVNWWHGESETASRRPTILRRNLVPAPPPANKSSKCPICRGTRRNETLLITCGHLFCYKCIVEHIRREKKCPITKLPVVENHLIRILA